MRSSLVKLTHFDNYEALNVKETAALYFVCLFGVFFVLFFFISYVV